MIAFDECSILHLYKFKVPEGFQSVYGTELYSRNGRKLNQLVRRIKQPYRFVPGLRNNVHKAIYDLIGGTNSMMGKVFAKEVKDGLLNFIKGLQGWGNIERNKNCEDVQQIFRRNEKELTKEPNIPEIEDCEIIAGYRDYEGANKIIISEDEHFWRYKELIRETWGLNVVEEWNCHKL